AAQGDAAGGGLGDAGEDLEQRTLAGAVAADDPEDLALLHVEADILEGPEFLDRVALHDLATANDIGRLARGISDLAPDDVPQVRRQVARAGFVAMADQVTLRQVLDGDN